jgi:DNA polymerase-3 subunit alpha
MLFYSNTKTRKNAPDLFDTAPKEYPLPVLSRKETEDGFDELELLGFTLCDPFKLLASSDRGNTTANELILKLGKQVSLVGYVVTTKDAGTKNHELMHFGTFLDFQGNVFDTVHFPNEARKYPFRGRGFYALTGKVVEDFGIPTVEVATMEKLPMVHKRAEEFMREPVEYRSSSQVANTVA